MDSVRQLQGLTLVLTGRCNLRCSYCYQTSKKNQQMSWEVLESALKLVLDAPTNEFDVTFSGGEPTLRFKSMQRGIRHLLERKRREQSLRFELFTNGMLLDHDSLEFLEAHDVHIQLSIDGIEAAQRQRSNRSASVLHETLMRLAAQHSRYLRTRVRFAAVVTPATIDLLEDSMRYLVSFEPRSIRMAASITSGDEWEDPDFHRLDRALRRVGALCREVAHRDRPVPIENFRPLASEANEAPERRTVCDLSRRYKIVVDTDGHAYACSAMIPSYQEVENRGLSEAMNQLRLGSVLDGNVTGHFNELPLMTSRVPHLTGKENHRSSYMVCRECPAFGSCVVCPNTLDYDETGRHATVPRMVCAFNILMFKHRQRLIVRRRLDSRRGKDELMG